jgi:hypothetical protein
LRPLAPFRGLAARRTRQKAPPVEAVKAHGLREQLKAREIRRQFKHLSAIARMTARPVSVKFGAG